MFDSVLLLLLTMKEKMEEEEEEEGIVGNRVAPLENLVLMAVLW